MFSGKTMGPAQDVTTDGYYSLIQRSLLIVVDSQDEFVHRFHQPCKQNIHLIHGNYRKLAHMLHIRKCATDCNIKLF